MTSFQSTTRSLFGILAMAGLLGAIPQTHAQGLPPARPVAPVATARPAGVKTDTNRTVELKFNQAALDMVLQYYCSELTGRTLLQAPNVNAIITLRSQTELTIPEAIQAIKAVLAMNNIALVNQGDKFVKAVPITAASQEGLQIQSNMVDQIAHPETDELVSEVVPLKFIDPAEAQKAITGLIHTYGKILPLERINSLMIADTAVNLNRIKDILTRIDQPLDIKESIHILQMRNSKPSDIKAKLEEIIADQKEKEKQPTVRRLKDSGAPGVDTTPAPAPIPGVIRARNVTVSATAKAATPEGAESEAGDDRMIRGNVKVIADDRTGSLIIITRPENMRFFEQVVAALDVGTAPDVTIEVLRLEFADAEEVASMLNALIGAAATPSSKSSTPKKTATTTTTRPDGSTGPSTTTSVTREEPRSFQLQEFIEQQRQLASAKGAEGKTKVGQLSAENIKILADKRINGLILMASKADMAALKDILKSMDVMLSQVLIEAVIMQVSLDKNMERGVDWVQRSMIAYSDRNGGRKGEFAFAGGGGGGKVIPLNSAALNTAASIPSGAGLTYYMTQFGLNLDAVIKMSQSDNRSKIIASPVILTTDNKEAKIDVSEERYFYKGVSYSGYVSGAQQQAIPNVESRKVGLTLTVTPRINAKKFVVMEIAQKIENINGTQTISDGTGGANDWPIVASREMNAAVSVRSGETIILGGLVENNNTENKAGIPFLSKIPFLGFLFGSHNDTGKRSEIVVFITPYVLDSPEEIETESARRKDALSGDTDGMWRKGWSDSNLAEPPKNRGGLKSLLK